MNKKLFIFLLFPLLKILYCKQYKMHKENNENNEFKPYIFNLSLDDQIFIYPSFFNMSSFYIHIQDEVKDNSISFKEHINNITINNQTFYYINSSTNYYENKYYASVGISKNFSSFEFSSISKKYNLADFSYLAMLQKEQLNNKDYKGSYISFIQNENNEAVMSFGEFDSQFDKGDSYKCQSEFGYYFSCQVSSIKIGVNEIYTTSTAKQEIGIFSLTDEYIILPNKPGNETVFYYKNKIYELFGIECKDENDGIDKIINMTCDYFNYEDLPDLYFEMKGGIGVMALSVDMFKILANYKLEFKLKYRKYGEDNSLSNKWILGEPVTKNYNLFVNYTDKEKPYLIIVPSSLNGFILILIATVGGFIFLFIFLSIIYCSAKKDNNSKNSVFERRRFSPRGNFFSIDKNYINEAIEEHEKEFEENEKEESEDNKSDDDFDKNDLYEDNILLEELKEDENNEEIKNLKINEVQNDNSNNTNTINNKEKMNQKDINNNEKMKNHNIIELIYNNNNNNNNNNNTDEENENLM